MPYKDPEKRKAYYKAYCKQWDKEHLDKRHEYAWRYRRPDLRKCKWCGAPNFDRRWRCSSCGISVRGPKQPRKSEAIAPTGECAICGLIAKLCRDHNHLTGKHRGLLCSLCNTGLGMFRDKPKLLRKAAAYVEKTK